jgi:hypothetical protein
LECGVFRRFVLFGFFLKCQSKKAAEKRRTPKTPKPGFDSEPAGPRL